MTTRSRKKGTDVSQIAASFSEYDGTPESTKDIMALLQSTVLNPMTAPRIKKEVDDDEFFHEALKTLVQVATPDEKQIPWHDHLKMCLAKEMKSASTPTLSHTVGLPQSIKTTNSLLKSMSEFLKLDEILPPKTMEDAEVFLSNMANARTKIVKYCERNNFPVTLGTSYLGVLLQGSEAHDYDLYVESTEHLQEMKLDLCVESTEHLQEMKQDPVKAFHKLCDYLTLQDDLADQNFEEAMNKMKTMTFLSFDDLWSHYTTTLNRFPDVATSSLHALSLHLRSSESHQRFTELKSYRKFVANLESTMHRSHGYSSPGISSYASQTSNNRAPCRNWTQHGTCRYGNNCRYSHSTGNSRGNNMRTETKQPTVCKKFWIGDHCDGSCNLPHTDHKTLWNSRNHSTVCPTCGSRKSKRFTYCRNCAREYKTRYPSAFPARTTSHRNTDASNRTPAMEHAALETKLETLQRQIEELKSATATPGIAPVDSKAFAAPTSGLHQSIRKDLRVMVHLKPGLLALADNGGQVSMCGLEEMKKLKSVSNAVQSTPINIPVRGVGGSHSLTGIEHVNLTLQMKMKDATHRPLTAGILVCSGFSGVVIGMRQ
eukprot:CAMPEP_0167758846 /NCGR_PEP_ID=MMETSP0110_2-20121227/10698_1 /TAXON_ID=629695 /ORGANISM="Gymnochlora sp., Strain CCMP2014" /LENGTH=598 /DNA_ID=CAMNT_0007645173 /DNA_START=211 /DNA_END=2009 /DNA_ORIENTATION=+